MGIKSPPSRCSAFTAAGRINAATKTLAAATASPMANSRPVGGSAAAPPSRAESLSNRGGHHVVPERGFPAALASGARRQHLMAGHAEHVAEAQEHGKAEEMHRGPRPSPKADAGGEHERRAQQGRSRIVAAIDPAPDLQGRKDRDNCKAGGDDTEPDDWKAEFDGPVGRRYSDDEGQRLDERDVSQERNQQPVIDIALGKAARARLLNHRRIVSRARAGLLRRRWRAHSFTGVRARGKALAAGLFLRRSTANESNGANMVYEGLRHLALPRSRPVAVVRLTAACIPTQGL